MRMPASRTWQLTIERTALESGVRQNVAGEPLNLDMIGPTAGAWLRDVGDAGRVAYFSTDGGIKNPLSGVVRESKVLRCRVSCRLLPPIVSSNRIEREQDIYTREISDNGCSPLI